MSTQASKTLLLDGLKTYDGTLSPAQKAALLRLASVTRIPNSPAPARRLNVGTADCGVNFADVSGDNVIDIDIDYGPTGIVTTDQTVDGIWPPLGSADSGSGSTGDSGGTGGDTGGDEGGDTGESGGCGCEDPWC